MKFFIFYFEIYDCNFVQYCSISCFSSPNFASLINSRAETKQLLYFSLKLAETILTKFPVLKILLSNLFNVSSQRIQFNKVLSTVFSTVIFPFLNRLLYLRLKNNNFVSIFCIEHFLFLY